LRLLAGDAVPEGAVTANLGFDAQLLNHQDLLSARLELDFEEGSRWNGQAVGGKAHFNVDNVVPVQEQTAEQRQGDLWKGLQLSELDVDLRVGEHHIKGQGDLGMSDSRLSLDIQANRLADLWPDLPGGANAQLEVAGGLASHEATLKGVYTPADPNPQKLGQAPIQLDLAVRGGWGALPSSRAAQESQLAASRDNAPPDRIQQAGPAPDHQDGTEQQPAQASENGQEATTAALVPVAPLEGWRAEITRLNVGHAGVNVALQSPLSASFAPAAVMP